MPRAAILRSDHGTRLLWAAGFIATAFLAAASIKAEEPGRSGADDGLYRLYPRFDSLPGIQDQQVRNLWAEGIRSEARWDFSGAARVYEEIARKLPDDSHAYWRAARSYWQVGEYLPPDDNAGRIKYFTLTEQWATDGLDVNPECGACCLYRFAGIARLATTRGLFSAMRHAREMARLLDRGIALNPTHTDNEWNTTLGNLYSSASHFYRLAPEWLLLKWIIGVRGDRARALDYARKAHAISPMRIDYHLTLGAALLCVGTENSEEDPIMEGIAVLSEVPTLPIVRPRADPLFRKHAAMLIADPEKACAYSPDGLVDVEGTLSGKDTEG
jgi:tetratricopeptide (TPR) repeat protein